MVKATFERSDRPKRIVVLGFKRIGVVLRELVVLRNDPGNRWLRVQLRELHPVDPKHIARIGIPVKTEDESCIVHERGEVPRREVKRIFFPDSAQLNTLKCKAIRW